MSGRAKYDTGTLTRDQIKDMNLAGRNASTGKRYRTSGMTELEKQSKISNWNKLMVKGAIRNLTTVGANTRINNGNYEQYKAALDKLENLLLRQLDEDYKEFKEKVLAERENSKAVDDLRW